MKDRSTSKSPLKEKDGPKRQRRNRQVVNLNNVKRMLYRQGEGLEVFYLDGKGRSLDLNRSNFTHFERPEKMGMFLNIGDFHPLKCEVMISTHESFDDGSSHGTCGVYVLPINESNPTNGLLFTNKSAEKITLADLVRVMIRDEWLIQSSTPTAKKGDE